LLLVNRRRRLAAKGIMYGQCAITTTPEAIDLRGHGQALTILPIDTNLLKFPS